MVVNKSCVAACQKSVRMTVESVSGCSWNECPDQRGITVRMRVEWVSESAWNPQEETVPDKHVSFEQVVSLSHPDAPAESNVTFSMTYRNAASFPHAGELGAGGSVEVKKQGTIFNVTRTVQS